MIITVWRNTHLILALLCSVILLLSSITGTILSLAPVEHKSSSFHIGNAADVNLGEFITGLQEKYVEVIDFSIEEEERLKVSVITEDGDFLETYLNGSTYEVLGEPEELPWIYSFSKKLHRSLFMGELGRAIVGIVTGLFLLVLISGVILLAKRQMGIKNILGPVTYDSAFRYWHIQISRFSFPLILIIGLSGTYLSMDRFEWLPSQETTEEQSEIIITEEAPDREPIGSFEIFREIELGDVKMVSFPFSPEPDDYFIVTLNDREIYVNQFDGSVLYEKHQSASEKWVDYAFFIHTDGVGIVWPLILLIGSLSIFFLIVSGFISFARRKRKKVHNTTRQQEADYAIYVGSESGSTYHFAEQLQQALGKVKKSAFIAPLNAFKVREKQEIVILTATYGDGEPPSSANKMLKRLKLNPPTVHFSYSVVGFGSYEYPKFCQFAIDVNNQLQKLPSSSERVALQKIHGRSQPNFEKWISLWSKQQHLDLRVEQKENDYNQLRLLKKEVIRSTYDENFLLELNVPHKESVRSGDLLAIRPSLNKSERYYSIAVVNDKIVLSLKRHQSGVCSNYLFQKKVNDHIKARIVINKKFHFTHTRHKNLFIANGTGIAPFLGMPHQTSHKNNLRLIWGGKTRTHFELYKIYVQETGIPTERIHIAYSREENQDKTYVQDVIEQHPEYIVEVLSNKGTIYICGSIKMQTDVFEQIDKVCKKYGLKSRKYYQRKNKIKTDCY